MNRLIIEVDASSGNVLKQWNLGDIISAAMVAGGDDPSPVCLSRSTLRRLVP